MCPAELRLALKVALWLREGRLIGVAALATGYGCGTKAARARPPQHLASATLLQGHQSPIHRPHHYTPPPRTTTSTAPKVMRRLQATRSGGTAHRVGGLSACPQLARKNPAPLATDSNDPLPTNRCLSAGPAAPPGISSAEGGLSA